MYLNDHKMSYYVTSLPGTFYTIPLVLKWNLHPPGAQGPLQNKLAHCSGQMPRHTRERSFLLWNEVIHALMKYVEIDRAAEEFSPSRQAT